MRALADAFHSPATRAYRAVTLGIASLILASILLFTVELLLDHDSAAAAAIRVADRVILLVFLVEYVLRVVTFRPPALELFRLSPLRRLRVHLLGRLRFCLRPLMLVDLLTLSALIPALRGLRALRLLRLLRHLRVFRYSDPVLGIARAFRDNRLLFGFAFSVLGFSTLLGGLSMYLAEHGLNPNVHHLADGMWWALVTICTVGFGDIAPITAAGRLIGSLLMVDGLFILALFAGIVSHTILRSVLALEKEQHRMGGYMNHVVVCGYDPGARLLLDAVIAEIEPAERDLLVMAPDPRPADLPDAVTWVSGDPTKESELDKARVVRARAVVVAGSRTQPPARADAVSILTVFTIRRYLRQHAETAARQQPLRIVAEILDAENVDHALAAGADEVVETNSLGFALLAHALTMPGTADVLSRVALRGAQDLFVSPVPPGIDLPLGFASLAARVRERTGILIIGCRLGDTGADVINPSDGHQVRPGDRLIYLAERPLPDPA